MLAGTALCIRLLVYAGLSSFIISGLYVYMVVCVVYAYNLTMMYVHGKKLNLEESYSHQDLQLVQQTCLVALMMYSNCSPCLRPVSR